MELTTRNKVIIVVVYTAVAVAAGRYLVPLSTKTESSVAKVEVEKEKKDVNEKVNVNKDRDVTKTTTKKILPDGTQEIVTTVVESFKDRTTKDTDTSSTDDSTKTEASKETKTVERSGGRTNISAIAGIDVTKPTSGLVYGAHVTREILGPISIGVFGMTSGVCGASVGIGF